MLDIKEIRNNPDKVKKAMTTRNENPETIEEILSLDEKRRDIIQKADELKALRNQLSKSVAKLKSQGNHEEASKNITESKNIGNQIKEYDEELKEVEEKQNEILAQLPNLPSVNTPVGKDETENVEILKWGTPREFSFDPKPHWEIGPDLGMMDFERASKLSGSRFVVLRSQIARLERALISFMLDTHTENGYTEVNVPYLVKRETMYATGQLPKFEEEAYKTTPDDMFLIPTAEVFLAGMHKDDIIEYSELPLNYCAYSACFRREAGSYGKDVRGMIRVHQFEKVELVKYTTAETSYEELEKLTNAAENILKSLELPYRKIQLCTGDLGFGSALTYDLEVWLPSYNAYKEISSCSNDIDFQGRRANMRYRNKENRLEYVHTLNGSGLAVGRTLVAVLENYQNEDGSVTVPEVLRKYMGGTERIFG
ncbi:MAG TPA: serine--tRNA ligase [Thermotogota bacterium]|nr:serine--tRNA ligase [Thermotogota bacterium]HPJ88016.1 serine--tRNA ligase [Thermotogota bacterium]